MKKAAIILLCISFVLTLSGCKKSDTEYTINIKNLTGVAISEIYITPETNKSDLKNRLSENLETDSEISLSLGNFSNEDVKNGFAIEVVNSEDNSSGTFSMLHIENGDSICYYLDDWGIAVGVNMTEKEIQQQIQIDHEDYVAWVETSEAIE